jgi:Holliday junction resolvase RusA-like endonuclease
MPSINLVFYGNVPSKKNGRKWIKRGSKKFSVPSDAYRAWESAEKARLKSQYKSPKLIGFEIEIKPYFATNRLRDTDNLETSVLDCLNAAEIIKDDRWQYHKKPPVTHQPIIDPENPRVEVTITWDNATTRPNAKSAIAQ